MTTQDVVQTVAEEKPIVKLNKIKMIPVSKTPDTTKGIKKYIDLVKNQTKQYLNAVVNSKSEKVDFTIELSKNSKELQSIKPKTLSSFVKENMCFFLFSGILASVMMSVPMALIFGFVAFKDDLSSVKLLLGYLFLLFLSVGSFAIFSLLFRDFWNIKKTGYTGNVKNDIKIIHSKLIAFTHDSMYLSFYDKGKDKYRYKQYDLRGVNNVWQDKKTGVVELIGYNKEVVFKFEGYKIDKGMDFVKELKDRVRNAKIKMVAEFQNEEEAS